MISSQAYLPKIRSGRRNAPGVEKVILIDGDSPQGSLSYRRLIETSADSAGLADTGDDELAALIYTAGTTGGPKGVMHTHGSLYANARMQYESIDFPDGMTAISVLPLCHSLGSPI